MKWLLPILIIFLLSINSACKKSEEGTIPSGNVIFTVQHYVDGTILHENKLIYTNAAGNQYLITEVKYFISDITFYYQGRARTMVRQGKDIFYIDEDIPETKILRFSEKIPAGSYDSITFIFGIPEAKNKSFMFVNPPEVNMAWPQVLGGGYHYMMMNGKWKDRSEVIQPFNFHLGIGQLYHGNNYNTDSIYAFIQNYFTVSLPESGFTLRDGETLTFNLQMNIDSWFNTPHIYDHNFWGGAIMQNQAALEMVRENGWNVFSITPKR
ncbi:MAG: hypothetical protein M0Q38_14085 [Bacteroidales bacterium]|jgi:hypothetical protein|nr:hypothetical protein [Bacteroidales bacterium]